MLCAISVTPIHRGQKRGDGVGYSGYKHQKGEKIIVMIDNNGSALAPRPVVPVNEAIHTLRMRIERTFAWEDKRKRLLLRFEHIQQRHYGMKLLGYTLINLREFCSA